MTGPEQLERAERAFVAKDFDAAVAHARAAIAAGLDVNEPQSERGEYWPSPQLSSAEIVLGMALLELGQRDEALPHLDRAVLANRESMRAWANRGHLRRERGELALALVDFDEALRRDPSYAFARFRRAQTLLDLDRAAEAEEDLARLLMANPYDPAPFALWQQRRVARGLPADFDALPPPRDALGFLQRGVQFMGKSEFARALGDYEAACALSAEPFLRANRAMAHKLLGNFEAARADLEAYIATNPPGVEVWRTQLAEVLKALSTTA